MFFGLRYEEVCLLFCCCFTCQKLDGGSKTLFERCYWNRFSTIGMQLIKCERH